jgi:predicted transcriptional regulator
LSDETLLTLTADIVSAHVSNNKVSAGDVAALIAQVHSALSDLGKPIVAEEPAKDPAVSIRASVKPDYVVCLEDGMKLKMLKRHLQTHHNMTAAEYKAKWKLPADYPLVAPNYAEQRKSLALKSGLGKKKETPAAKPAKAKRTLKIASPS